MNLEEIAKNTFTIAALLLTATLVMLNYSWKRLKDIINTMPEGKRRVVFNLRSITDAAESDKYAYIGAQFFACVFLVLSFGGALAAVFEMSGVMVGDTGGIYAAENFEFAVVAIRIAVLCLFMGVFCSSMVYLEDLAALCTGKPSLVTTKLEELPKRPPKDKAWSYILSGLLSMFLLVLLLIELLVPFNQWVKMVFAFGAGVVLLVGTRFGYRTYVRIRRQRVSGSVQPGVTIQHKPDSESNKQV